MVQLNFKINNSQLQTKKKETIEIAWMKTPNKNNYTLFHKYKDIRSTLTLPIKLAIYFDLLEHSLTEKMDQKQLRKKQTFATQFVRGFMTLSKNEKQLMLYQSIQSLSKFCQGQSENDLIQQKQKAWVQSNQYGKKETEQHNIEQKCKVSGQIIGVPYWYSADFFFNPSKRNIMIMAKHSTLIDLRLYLVRRSKKHETTLVLESISSLTTKQIKKVSLFFKQQLFQRIYQAIQESIIRYRSQQIINLYVQGKKNSLSQVPYITDQEFQLSYANRPLVFLNQKNINQYLAKRGLINSHLTNLQEKYFPIYQNDLYTIFKCSQDSSVYKLQSKINSDQSSAKKKFIESLKNYKFIVFWQIMESFSVKYETVLQKYKFVDKKFTQIMIKQVNASNALSEQVMFLNHVDNIINKSFMQFCSFRIRQLDKKNSKLIIIGCFNPHLLGGISNLMLLLEQYVLMMDRTQTPSFQVTKATKQEYHSILQCFEDNAKKTKKDEKLLEFNQAQQFQSNQKKLSDVMEQKQKSQIKYQSSETYLTHHFQMNPIDKSAVEQNKLKFNFLYAQWKRAKNGGLVCVDQQKVNQQKAVGKKVLAKFGDQIFKGKGLMNISLPVEIFKKQSQLQSLAKNFTFAPQIMQSALLKNDHIQLLKSSTAYLMTNNILGLNYEKPFNPILGQTFQCSINGCPLYLQQISHHPPISAYYFVGRGYKMHGTVQPKISIGLNGAKGYSDNPHTIQLDNGTIMQLNISRMNITGFFFGERTFNYDGQSYVYDKTNNYFSDMFFGPLKTSLFGANSDPEDYVSGKIYKVNQAFAQYFNENKPNIKIQKQHIVDTVCQYNGVWTQYFNIDKKTFLNFKSAQHDSPYQVQNQRFILQSDATLRDDLRLLIQQNIPKAQQAKQRMEQQQRNDRKLRKQHSKH